MRYNLLYIHHGYRRDWSNNSAKNATFTNIVRLNAEKLPHNLGESFQTVIGSPKIGQRKITEAADDQ